MNRILPTCGLIVLGVQTTLSLQATERPNILFILTDDQRDDSFSGMGHPWVQTPHIDDLLKQGIRFENAYIAEPTCRPSRASILLGCHERLNRNGFSSKHKMNKEQWQDSYPVMLKKAGYTTGYVGKWHVKTDRLKTETLFDYCKSHDGHGEFYYEETAPDGSKQTVTTNRYHTNNALNFLRSDMAKQPFCLSVSFATPHGSKVTKMHDVIDKPASENPKLKDHHIYGADHGGKYRNIDIPYPLQNAEDPYKHIPLDVMDQNRGRSKTYRFDYDPASNKEHLYRYYQMITEIDQMVGELVTELKEQGLNEKTIVIYASDHGLLLGEYGMGGKGLLYDLSAKFPCFVVDPKAAQRGVSRKEVVSSLDLSVTMLDYAGVKPAPFMTGQSLKPLIRGVKTEWRDGLILENLYTGRDTPLQEGYVDGNWKYIRCFKAKSTYSDADVESTGRTPVWEMLFSLEKDPEEKTNLAQNPEYQEKLNEMRNKCEQEITTMISQRHEYAKHYGIISN